MTTSSPTGRLTTSMPEIQHFPGTPQAEAERQRMRAALAQSRGPVIDFSSLEDRLDVAQVQDYLKTNTNRT